jgi:hypothetical protein
LEKLTLGKRGEVNLRERGAATQVRFETREYAYNLPISFYMVHFLLELGLGEDEIIFGKRGEAATECWG